MSGDLLGSLPISNEDKLGAMRRELGMRRRVYPRWVDARKMTKDQADREIAIVEAIVADYERAVGQDRPADREGVRRA